tara:strand:- start:985 stop:1587 length:603 start_codon:yes stop_codon:yes gene_type:complete
LLLIDIYKMETTEKLKTQNAKAKKMMLWFGIGSICMTFAGLSSAYIVSSKRADWLTQIELPFSFTISTAIIILSSFSIYYSRKMLQENKLNLTKYFLITTLILSFLFTYFQFKGFGQVIDLGYYFTGPESSINTSYLYVLVLLHLAHLFAGIIVVIVLLINTSMGKYSKENSLGIELAETFWHFLDFLWIYLFLFVSFYS